MKDNIVDITLIIALLIGIAFLLVGCSSVKYSYKRDDVEIEARYYRFLNQEIEGLSLNTELFQAQLEDQESNNGEAVGSISGGIVEGIGKVVVP